MFKGLGVGMRALVYLKRISESLERIASSTEAITPVRPKLSKKTIEPHGEFYRPTVKEFNERFREQNPHLKPDDWY